MKGDKRVIEYLNTVLKNELTAINQYFLHSRILHDMGLHKLGKYAYDESIDEMNHADRVMQRILFLEGLPNLQNLNRLRIGETVPEMLKGDLELEIEACKDLREAIHYCEEVKDFFSRKILRDILDSEERHIDWLETQIGLIDKVGMENYLQSQMGEQDYEPKNHM